MKEDIEKASKKLTLFFLTNPVPFNGQSYQKQEEPGTSHQSLFRSQKKFSKISLFVIYYLTKFDDIMWRSFWVIPKITSANLCKSIHDMINYSTSTCPFESGKCGKEGKKSQKFHYLENKKNFLDEIKIIFQFLKGYHLVKKKIDKKQRTLALKKFYSRHFWNFTKQHNSRLLIFFSIKITSGYILNRLTEFWVPCNRAKIQNF